MVNGRGWGGTDGQRSETGVGVGESKHLAFTWGDKMQIRQEVKVKQGGD